MFEAMAELEATCGRLAAIRMEPRERQQLGDLHRSMGMAVRSGDQAVYEAQNRAFHDLIYAAARSDVLVEVTKQVRRRVSPFRRVQFTALSRLGSSYDEHQGIVDAIERGDGTEAYTFLHQHIMAVHELAQDFLESLQQKGRRKNDG
jgi:DNA-binding GntR family transcriptional regulator